MASKDAGGDMDSEEQTVERVLKAIGRGKKLPDETKSRWSESFRRELEVTVARKRKVRRYAVTGFAASVAILVLAILVVRMPGQSVDQQHWAVIEKSIGDIEIGNMLFRMAADPREINLAKKTAILTHQHGLLALNYRGVQLRINENTRIEINHEEVLLLSGRIYVDSDSSSAGSSVLIRTPLGAVRDIGTQFQVTYDRQGLTAMVRDGIIKVQTQVGEYTAKAADNYAQQLIVSPDNKVSVTRTDRSGDSWRWTEHLATEFSIEGRTAYEFLVWASNETGLVLIFESESVESWAKTTILHGDISGFTLPDVIDVVMATTDLSARREGNNILSISKAR